jgi:hypothetical protein
LFQVGYFGLQSQKCYAGFDDRPSRISHVTRWPGRYEDTARDIEKKLSLPLQVTFGQEMTVNGR